MRLQGVQVSRFVSRAHRSMSGQFHAGRPLTVHRGSGRSLRCRHMATVWRWTPSRWAMSSDPTGSHPFVMRALSHVNAGLTSSVDPGYTGDMPATLTKHQYTSGRIFWIAECPDCLVSLNSGHHYDDTESGRRLGQEVCDEHNDLRCTNPPVEEADWRDDPRYDDEDRIPGDGDLFERTSRCPGCNRPLSWSHPTCSHFPDCEL